MPFQEEHTNLKVFQIDTAKQYSHTFTTWLHVYGFMCIYIAQSVRASERNSVVVGSNPTQANFAIMTAHFVTP